MIRLSVEYYSDVELALFQKWPIFANTSPILNAPIEISEGEFLAYMMFTEQMEEDGSRTYAELREQIAGSLGNIGRHLTFDGGSVQTRRVGNDADKNITERFGVSLGLNVINKLHGFTEADWKKIPIRSTKAFDYEMPMASTGNNLIQVENKGSAREENDDPTAVDYHYYSIKGKKKDMLKEESKRGIPRHKNYYYGTIGVLSTKPSSIAKVWLVDPPAFEVEMDPFKYKLLARLHFYLDEFRNIGVMKSLCDALKMRIFEIEDSRGYMDFSLKPLLESKRLPNIFMNRKMEATINRNLGFGKFFVVQVGGKVKIFVVAYAVQIIKMVLNQDFEQILSFRYNMAEMDDDVSVQLSFAKGEYDELVEEQKIDFVLNERNGRYEAMYYGPVMHTSCGRIFGVLESKK